MFVHRRDPDARLGVGVAFTSAALDLSDRQDPTSRARAYARLSREVGVPVAVAAQVHGADVLRVGPPAAASGLIDLTSQHADALVTTHPGVAVAVRVADCVPICIAATDASAVAAVHAGRNGLLGGVIGAAVAAVRAVTDADLVAWVGPHVCATCYEVPHALAREAAERLGTPIPATRWGTEGIDLGAAARLQLRAAGVAATDVAGCTLEDDHLHSHRRDADRAGRMAGLVWIAGLAQDTPVPAPGHGGRAAPIGGRGPR